MVAAGAILALAARPSLERLLVSGAAAAALYTCAFAFAIPAMDRLWTSDRLGEFVATLDGCATIEVVMAGYREPSLAFNLGTETWLAYDGADAARALLERADCGVAIVDESWRADFDAALSQSGASVRKLGRYEGYNAVKGDDLSLSIVTLQDSRVTAAVS